jgi:predicted nucleotidyltransferase
MRVAGILCEYNPFHIGHLQQIRAVADRSDFVICLMSGPFVQRGEPAIYHKFARAKWALMAGADAVFELPCVHALSSAEGFAMGGMRLFDLMGVDAVYFGSECPQDALTALSRVYLDNPPAFDAAFRRSMSEGLPYAAARECAARAVLPDLPNEAFMRNAVLGVAYITALRRLHSAAKPRALSRFGGVSASAVRQALLDDGGEAPGLAELPDFVLRDIPSLTPVSLHTVSDALLGRLRAMTKADFANLPDMSEGLENRLYRAARRATTVDELLSLAAHRRMPLSRVKRALMCALIGLDEALSQKADERPGYLRLLGIRAASAGLVAAVKEKSGLPIVTQPARHSADAMLDADVRATDIHALFAGLPCGLDYTTRLITV